MKNLFEMEFTNIQPSQLYISKYKLAKIKEKFNPKDISTLEPILIKKIGKEIFYVDGHTRAFAAYQMGLTKIPIIWEDEELDWELYKICIKWCKDAGICSIADLGDRIVDQKEYEILWYKRCEDLHKKFAADKKQEKKAKIPKIPS